MSWPAVKFMSAPDLSSGTVRLDLNNDLAGVRVAADGGFEQGHPTFEGAPESYGVEYSYRDGLQFTVNITGTKAAASAVLQKLAVELLRRENWLLFQLQPSTPPVWFHTWRQETGDLSLDAVYDETGQTRLPDMWQVTVPLTADSFIYGARETIPTATITNDPASGTNKVSLTLPTIKGDAPAPLRIAVDFSNDLNQADVFWSVAPVPASYSAPIVWPIGTGDGLTAGTDTGAAVANAAYSGGSYRPVSFATAAGMVTRLSGSAPAAIPSGRYQVFVRFARSDTSSTFAFRFGYTGLAGVDVSGSDTVIMDRNASTTAGHATWAPLGVFSFPKFSNDLQVPSFDAVPGWALQAQRLSGTGAVNIDAIVLVPVDLRGIGQAGRSLFSRFDAFGPQGGDNAVYWDGDLEAFTRVNGFGVNDTSIQPSTLSGGFPRVYPGQTNVLHLLQQTRLGSGFFGTTDNPDVITYTAAVTLSYYPRYLYTRGD